MNDNKYHEGGCDVVTGGDCTCNKRKITTLEKLDRLIIERIHGLEYEEAVKLYYTFVVYQGGKESIKIAPFTIGRIMQALNRKYPITYGFWEDEIVKIEDFQDGREPVGYQLLHHRCEWKLTKENGQECTTADQNQKTQDSLYNLLK